MKRKGRARHSALIRKTPTGARDAPLRSPIPRPDSQERIPSARRRQPPRGAAGVLPMCPVRISSVGGPQRARSRAPGLARSRTRARSVGHAADRRTRRLRAPGGVVVRPPAFTPIHRAQPARGTSRGSRCSRAPSSPHTPRGASGDEECTHHGHAREPLGRRSADLVSWRLSELRQLARSR